MVGAGAPDVDVVVDHELAEDGVESDRAAAEAAGEDDDVVAGVGKGQGEGFAQARRSVGGIDHIVSGGDDDRARLIDPSGSGPCEGVCQGHFGGAVQVHARAQVGDLVGLAGDLVLDVVDISELSDGAEAHIDRVGLLGAGEVPHGVEFLGVLDPALGRGGLRRDGRCRLRRRVGCIPARFRGSRR